MVAGGGRVCGDWVYDGGQVCDGDCGGWVDGNRFLHAKLNTKNNFTAYFP